MVLPTYTPLSIDAVLVMDVAFSLPEDLARRLQEQWGDLSQRALESLVAQAYREDSLTLGEVRRILGHETRLETESFLKERDALLDYSEEELEQDLEAALNASNR
jgi:predicted HTH domain antitoxin